MKKNKHPLSNFFQNILDWIFGHKYWLTAVALLIALRVLASTVFWTTVIAFFLYILVHPLMEYLKTKTKSHLIAAFITVILLTGFLTFALSVIIPTVISQIPSLTTNVQSITTQIQPLSNYLQEKIQEFQKTLPVSVQDTFNQNIDHYTTLLSNGMVSFFTDISKSLTRIVTSVFQVLVAYILFIYMLFDTKPIEQIKNFLLRETTAKEKKMLTATYEQLTGYFGGQILMSVLSFIAVWIFYSIIGLRFSLLLALWDSFMQFIPFFGPLLAMAPAILVAIPNNMNLILPILIYYGIQQCILAYILAPNIFSKSMRLSPLVVFLVLMIGAEIGGLWCMIFSLPLTSLIILYIKNIKNKNA